MQWRENGKVRTQAFGTAADRDKAAQALAAARADHGREILTFDPRDWRRWVEFRDALGEEGEPMQVLREWRDMRKERLPATPPMTVAKAVEEYLKMRKAEAPLSEDTERHMKKRLETRFAGRFGRLPLCGITAEHIRAWLAGLVNKRNGAPAQNLTRRHHRKDLNTFLKRAVVEGGYGRNPCEAVIPPVKEQEDVAVLPVGDVRRLFEVNKDEACVGRLALEAKGKAFVLAGFNC